MSLFDPPNQEKLADVYPHGTPFMLYSGAFDGTMDTQFGPTAYGHVSVGNADRSGDPVEFRVFGALAEALRQMDHNDLPTMVCLKKEGKANRWSKVDVGSDPLF